MHYEVRSAGWRSGATGAGGGSAAGRTRALAHTRPCACRVQSQEIVVLPSGEEVVQATRQAVKRCVHAPWRCTRAARRKHASPRCLVCARKHRSVGNT